MPIKDYNILITGYYNKQNTGDDLFEHIAKKLFISNKNYKYKIKSIDEVKNDNSIASNFDRIVLFGGETLNNYFLEPLAKIKEKNQNIKLYALGVGLGADIESIKQYLIMFQYIIVRHKQDYALIKNRFDNLIPCEYIQDIVFMYDVNGYKTKIINKKCVGLFLSQPKLKNEDSLNDYNNIINYYLKNNYTIKLFNMCYSENMNESDYFANKLILENIPKKYKHLVKLVSNKSFEKSIKTIDFAICERFHSHILCLINNIPFISFGNTLKVKKLLDDLELNELLCNSYDINNLNINCKNKIFKAYKNTYPSVIKFYSRLINTDLDDLIIHPKNKIKYYFSDDKINTLCETSFKMNNTNNILMNIFGTTNLEYKWGLEDKIKKNILTIDDIKWLIEQSIYKHYYLHLINYGSNKGGISGLLNGFNIDYIDQYDRTGCHRSGWRYVVDNINNNLSSSNINCIKLDLYVDRTFHWSKNDMINNQPSIIPYKTYWVGFIHHTLYKDESNYNCIELLKNKYFIESLKYCKCLIFLSKYLKDNFQKLANINNIKLPNLYNLYHPAEFINSDKLWHYKLWKGDVIQIGSWMRDMNAIDELNYNKKHILIGKQSENKYICNTNIKILHHVNKIDYLNNDDYDDILSRYVVFIKLFDASAVNTLIECIVRNTPIIINKLPAIIEYLGEDYPLYYNNIEDVPLLLKRRLFNNKIKKAHKYLKNMNKDFLKIDNFLNSLYKIIF